MSNIHEFGNPTHVYDIASEWIARIDRGLSQQEEEALRLWLAEAPNNREVFLDLVELWDKMDSLSRLSAVCPHPVDRRGPRNRSTLAASVLAVLAFGIWAGVSYFDRASVPTPSAASPSASLVAYETAIGEQSKISLSDGTELTLNTNTLVRTQYSNKHRLLILGRGEIHVRVAHDEFRPLSVIAGDRIVQAMGTAFNIKINSEDDVELVVTAGKVRVGVYEPRNAAALPGSPIVFSQSTTVVSAGEEVNLDGTDMAPDMIEQEEIAVKLSWREGNLIFRGESLEEAVAEIGRYTSVEFVIIDEKSRKQRVAGMFKAGDVNGLLAALEENFNVTHRRVGDNRIELKGQ